MEQQIMYELTNPQKSIWLTEQYFQNTTINNICGSLLIKQDTDLKLLNKAINIFVRNNDSFKLRFKQSSSNIEQYFAKDEYFNFEVLDISDENQIEVFAKKIVNTKFNIFDSRVFDFKLFKLSSGFGGFIVNVHHIISDAATFSLIGTEIAEIYSKLLNNEEIPTKNYSYIDYINSEKEYLKSSRFEKDKAFWAENLNPLPEIATVFSLKNVADINDYKAKRLEFILNSNLISKIKDYCAQNKVSLFNFLIGIYSIYLGRINNMDNFLIGTPILNRTNYAEKHTSGMYISTSLLNINTSSNLSFTEFVKNVTIYCMQMLRHQKYNYQYIVDDVRKKDNTISNLYDVLLSYQITKATDTSIGIPYSTKWYGTDYIGNTLDIHFHDNDDTGCLLVEYDYQVAKLNSSDINDMHKRILYIIDQVLSNSNINIHDIDIVTPNEKDLILNTFNKNAMDFYPKHDIIETFKTYVKNNPNKIALVFKEQQISYKQLDIMSDNLAQYLINLNVKENEKIAIFLDKSIEMIVSILAVLKSHSAYLPIDISYPLERIDYILNDANVNKIITSSNLSISTFNNCKQVFIDKLDLNTVTNFDYKPRSMDATCYVMYTSGSTGKPKGVIIEQKSILRLVINPNYIKFEKEERILQTGSIVFDACTFEIWAALLHGFSLYILAKEELLDSEFLAHYLVKNKITILWLTAALFNQLCDINSNMFKNVKYLLTGGDILSTKHIEKVMRSNPNLKVINGYGPTENTTFTCCFNIDKLYSTRIPIGYPISGTTCYIVSKFGKLQPVGVPGELWTGGLGVAKGYLNKPDLTAEKFIKNPFNDSDIVYKTGDLVKWLPNGSIDFLGRNDNQVKIRGFRVELNEINNTILSYSSVKNCVTIIQNINDSKSICSYVIPKSVLDVMDLKNYLSKTLPTYMIPSHFIIMDEFPITVNGKIDKSNLPLPKTRPSKKSIAKPVSPLEHEIYSAVISLCSEDKISIDDNLFYDIGLDSLDAMQLCSKLYQYHINIQDISNFPTIRLLADKIEKNYNISIFENNLPYIPIIDKPVSFDLSSVLITGALGYLSMHLLDELLHNDSVKKVYCMVRNKSRVNYLVRFQKMINYYFGNTLDDLIAKKVNLICGDFVIENFNMSDSDFENLANSITTVIHCGATVKHFGNFKKFHQTNVIGTEHIIDFCKISQAKLAHISTISVGGYCQSNNEICLSEDDFNIGQIFNNHVYMITKYLAEYHVLQAFNSNKIEGKIFRLGNIMPRLSDNVFQYNVKDNAIATKLQIMLDLKYMPESYSNLILDFSPVDLCAKSIVKLLELNDSKTVYHIYNNNIIQLKKILNFSKINCKIISDEKMIDIVKNSSNPLSVHILDDLMHTNYHLTPTDNKKTTEILNSNGFYWNLTDEEYISKFLNLFK